MDHSNIFEIAFNAKNGKYGDEDLLTDLYAWYLRQDTDIAIQFIKLLTGITPTAITNIETQPTFAGFSNDFPDMVITTPQVIVICEHKVGSALGNEQLERYLKIVISEEQRSGKPHRLAFIARDLVMVSSSVHQVTHYCPAPEAIHFRWKDVYRLIQDNLLPEHPQHDNRIQFLNCMRYLKLAFLTPTGKFNLLFSSDPAQTENRKLQEEAFGEAWKTIDGTVAWFENLGFKPDYGSRKELYLIAKEISEVPNASGLKHLHISPTDGKNMPKEAIFQPPCLKCVVHFNKECPDVIDRMISYTPAKLEAAFTPVIVKKGKLASDPVLFWFPLGPILEASILSDSLRDIVVELYQKVIHPAFETH